MKSEAFSAKTTPGSSKSWDEERAEVLAKRICELPLKIEGTFLETQVNRLYREMENKGLVYRPLCYLTDEWGCPDGIPVIGIPFYLADKKLSRIEEEYTEFLEKEEDIIVFLRHEAGHAFNYAYELYKTQEWHTIFGPYSRPYRDDYKPNYLSKKYVRHMKNMQGWYAQKHPDEDFAETFAVWLSPDEDWRKKYEGWGALEKLEYVERIAKEIGHELPRMNEPQEDEPASELKLTILEFYERNHSKEYPKMVTQLGSILDGDLREIFESEQKEGFLSAQEFIRRHRHTLRSIVYYWTGTSNHLVRALIRYLGERTAAANIYYDPSRDQQYLLHMEAFLLTLAMNYRYTNRFLEV